ncbi:MAG: sialate O-acetylesterase [Bacteroidales bacterium]|nr:sialate O-acetylesterase [Bacteroidales bacterium]
MKLKALFSLILFVWSCLLLDSQNLALGELFNEGVVLQRNAKVLIWGKATPTTSITVTIQGKMAQTTTSSSGEWKITLPKLKEGGPYLLSVYDKNDTLKINEVYVGEVWIAGGQSNMGFMLQNADNGKEAIENAKNTNIRFVLVPYKAFEGDKNRGDMNWRTATTDNVAKMSAVGYYFAKELQQKLNVPIGIICCYKGGSGAETWMSRESLLKNPIISPIVEKYETQFEKLGKERYYELVSKYQKDEKLYQDSLANGFKSVVRPREPMGEQNYNRPYGLYNTMLKRVIPFTLRGAIWYQGEHNSSRAAQYRTLFPAMIDEWRSDFENPQMPFLFVQLPGYANADANNRPIWPELREAQLLTLQKVKNTGMAVTIDLGQKDNIHPTHKEPVGKRLAAIAFHNVYGMKIPYSGPIYKSVKFIENKATIGFDFTYDGLRSETELAGFTICGEDQQFVSAKAIIKGNSVVVWSDSVQKPIAVRYGWANWTEANLKNSAGFLASPFRTDNFPLITDSSKK